MNTQTAERDGLSHSPLDVAALVKTWGSAESLADGAEAVVDCAVQVTGARWAEIVVPRADGRLEVVASRDALLTRELMRAVRDSRQGPPTPSSRLGVDRIVIDDLATDAAWPDFSALAVARTPVRSAVLQFLVVGGRYAAVLPVYHDEPGFFTEARQRSIATVASVAGVTLAGLAAAEEARQLSSALESNRLIATAVGITMATEQVSRLVAYERLKRESHLRNVKLRDVASEVVERGARDAVIG